MAEFVTKIACLALLGAAGMALSNPVNAQSFDELDRLSDLTVNEESGIAAAQDQAARGLLLEALAALERVMAVYPESLNARMLHAFYLCAIDDQQGARVEINNMDEDDFGRQNLSELRARCPAASNEFRVLPAAPVQGGGKKG
ncbi:hypothetical protein [Aurantiacibacter marinus]|uniref:Uncharacterized protein n=1 Tax=Aurantiacibacter marinus TaxID=874156 RepID=A0A0H0XRL9_9SPHN|nr:hypothetical protein [Aurantiacibacter marinus]KLI62905.1 hypothetical protein AAV99_12630 [Aurantiacibacter marinus]